MIDPDLLTIKAIRNKTPLSLHGEQMASRQFLDINSAAHAFAQPLMSDEGGND